MPGSTKTTWSDQVSCAWDPHQNDQAVEAVVRSIREFGFRQPIVVDEQGVIIVGHTRWKAAKKLGRETVPVHVAVGLTPDGNINWPWTRSWRPIPICAAASRSAATAGFSF